jgi:hypothetical protein
MCRAKSVSFRSGISALVSSQADRMVHCRMTGYFELAIAFAPLAARTAITTSAAQVENSPLQQPAGDAHHFRNVISPHLEVMPWIEERTE